jgi:hypothetical protein
MVDRMSTLSLTCIRRVSCEQVVVTAKLFSTRIRRLHLDHNKCVEMMMMMMMMMVMVMMVVDGQAVQHAHPPPAPRPQ